MTDNRKVFPLKELPSVLQPHREAGIDVAVTTNGSLMTENVWEGSRWTQCMQ